MYKELTKALLESTSEGILIINEELEVTHGNNMALKILGLTNNMVINKNVINIFNYEELLNKSLIEGQSFRNEDCTFNVLGNKVRCVTNIVPISDSFKINGLVIAFRDTRHIHRMVNNVVGYKANYTFEDIITKNQGMKKIIQYSKKASNADCNILLEGRSGTGKEIFAQAIHNYSKRQKGPFVAVNCAAIPRELVESELFGYEKGAFTGASKGGYPGKFELADGGTIFLDEIGELPLDIQSKLLRVLDNHKIVRVGSTFEKNIDVRVIAATNRNLMDEVENKNFRYDLYYRINVIGIGLMDLKDRNEDIELLVDHFMNKLNSKNPNNVKYIDRNLVEKFKTYNWDGNIRELRNVIEKAYYLSDVNRINEKCIESIIRGKSRVLDNSLETINKEEIIPLKVAEEKAIRKAIMYCKGSAEEAAKMLGISRATIYRKISKYGIKEVK